jgi:DNA-binding HxlR family transcriptional regulator
METRSYSCGLDIALSVVGGKWKPIVLFHLGGGPRRFGELKRLVAGFSEKVLIQQVRELAEDGVIVRRDYGEIPPRVDYEMTAFGQTLARALMPLCAWGDENRQRIDKLMSEKAATPAND